MRIEGLSVIGGRRMRSGVAALCAALLVAACGWGCSATEEDGPPPYPEALPPAPEDAVFGLSWSYTEEQLLAAGVIKGDPEPIRGKLGHMYSELQLPRRFEDADWCALFFNDDGEMLRIACVGETVKDDPTGEQMRKRYDELKEAISRKIPIVENFEENDGAWPRDQDWWASLKDGRVHWATGFRGDVMEAVLEIRAESELGGAYSLIVDHLQRMQQFNRTADQSDKAIF